MHRLTIDDVEFFERIMNYSDDERNFIKNNMSHISAHRFATYAGISKQMDDFYLENKKGEYVGKIWYIYFDPKQFRNPKITLDCIMCTAHNF